MTELVTERLMNHFNVHAPPDPRTAVAWHNRLQKLAEETRSASP
ncbi:MAG: hypothetical protein R2838_21130 [Caldilineaceae bacterium]